MVVSIAWRGTTLIAIFSILGSVGIHGRCVVVLRVKHTAPLLELLTWARVPCFLSLFMQLEDNRDVSGQ